jgi:hypothetical protein
MDLKLRKLNIAVDKGRMFGKFVHFQEMATFSVFLVSGKVVKCQLDKLTY